MGFEGYLGGKKTIIGIAGTNLTGRLGSGKTLYAVLLLKVFKKKLPKYRVLSNIHLYGIPYTLIKNIHELRDQDHVIVILDDVYRWINAYKQSGKIAVLSNTISGESRKVKQHYIWTSARYIGGAHKGLRDLTEVVYVPSYDKKTRCLTVRACMDYGDGRLIQIKPSVRYGAETVTKLFKNYNTWERVPPIEDV